MKVFISHSFENKPEFENMADGLAYAGVDYWNPAEIKPGASLRDQLRQAVKDCCACIFVATHRALESSWCGVELGAFWGVGKPIIAYVADSSLNELDLPSILHGDVWERKISLVAKRAKELVAQAEAASGDGAGIKAAPVGSITVEQLENIIVSAVSLAAAAAGKLQGHAVTPEQISKDAKAAAGLVLTGIETAQRAGQADGGAQKRILWVDDRPDNNAYERRAFESMGFEFTLALTTQEALEALSKDQFAAIISDMGRREGPREGYVLLDAVRERELDTPFFIYAGSNSPAHRRETVARGGQGTTNMPDELFDMVIAALRHQHASADT